MEHYKKGTPDDKRPPDPLDLFPAKLSYVTNVAPVFFAKEPPSDHEKGRHVPKRKERVHVGKGTRMPHDN